MSSNADHLQRDLDQAHRQIAALASIIEVETGLADALADHLMKVAPSRVTGVESPLDAWRRHRGVAS
jgi:hypothetical protein